MTIAVEAAPQIRTALLEIRALSKAFGQTVALDAVSIDVRAGEFFTIIGPSGSGKTTLLRILGGFEEPDAYETFRLAGLDLAGVPAHRRNVATVFQHYALFPHMTVGKNVEYGLKVRGIRPAERRRRAMDALTRVRLPHTYERSVGTLSGGERQRVALARALITEPALLLLDEPLGALDEKLRAEMQFELKQIQQEFGVAFVYITHNQDEALTMSDRLAVLHEGHLQQIGVPRDVYEHPRNRFVAGFMGAANLLPVSVDHIDRNGCANVRYRGVRLSGAYTGDHALIPDLTDAWLAIRPEHVEVFAELPGDDRSVLTGKVERTAYRGAFLEAIFRIDDRGQLTVRFQATTGVGQGSEARLFLDPAHCVVFPG
jgi:ABC-type Fe3+/spermidine/putrescine transport system ATPase subunit